MGAKIKRATDNTGHVRPVAKIPHVPRTQRIRRYPAADNSNHICTSIAFLHTYNYPRLWLTQMTRHACWNGTTGAAEAMAHGRISEEMYYRTLADHFGAEFISDGAIEEILTGSTHAPEELLESEVLWCRLADGRVVELHAPTTRSVAEETRDYRHLGARRWRHLTSRTALRTAILKSISADLVRSASDRLVTEHPINSARYGIGIWHGAGLTAAVGSIVVGLMLAPQGTLLTLHLVISLVFLSCVMLRIVTALSYRREPLRALRGHHNRERPVYSVMVALHDEAPVVPDLIQALRQMRWPRSKLEIKLVCEADDENTLSALAKETLDARFEIVRVPPAGPRTKPKALAFAFPLCTGPLVTIYDAEDRPHPHQIEEAWQRFRAEGDDLAALQAPLVMANPGRNTLTALFHLEYQALFLGLLQWLTNHRLPVALGGTSTHFSGIM